MPRTSEVETFDYSTMPCDIAKLRNSDNSHFATNEYEQYYEKLANPRESGDEWLQSVFVKDYLIAKKTGDQAGRCGTIKPDIVELGESLSLKVKPYD